MGTFQFYNLLPEQKENGFESQVCWHVHVVPANKESEARRSLEPRSLG